MSAVVPLARALREAAGGGVPAPAEADEWGRLPAQRRCVAERRRRLLQPVLDMVAGGAAARAAVEQLSLSLRTGRAEPELMGLARELGRGGVVDRSTLHRWLRAWQRDGLMGLVPAWRGRERGRYGWEARAIHLWQRPTKPAMSTVAHWLREEGHESATDDRVRRYLRALPADLGEHSPRRMGAHHYRQNLRPYVVRDNSVLPVGFIYEGDGHTCDVYVAHPATGNPWRPEFTAWLDVRSHYCVGWYLSRAESAVSTLYGLSHALVTHDHVPAAIHVDPGSGFRNRMISGEGSGFCERMGIEFMAALPGNAKGKGLVERFFGIFEERCGKRFETWCGHARSDEVLRRLTDRVRRGELTLPTLEQYRDAIAAWIWTYNHTPQDSLGGKSPAEVWAGLEAVALEMAAAAVVRPQERRKVVRWRVSLHNRVYEAQELAQYNGREVLVEYDLHDDREVTVRALDGRLVCVAQQVDAKPWLPSDRIEELHRKRLRGQIRRKERAIEEDKARAGMAITHEHVLQDLGSIEDCAGPVVADPAPASSVDPLDIFSTDY